MNIRDLKYLVAVIETGSFSRAAETCYVSQPTLSNQIKKLEEFLGVCLFERSRKSVMPTETGLKIAGHARRILREVDFLHETAQISKDPLAGDFKLGAFPTLAPYIFPSLIKGMNDALPKLRPVLVEEKTATLLDQLKSGDLDAALIALPVEDEQLETLPVFEDPFYLAVPKNHALAKQAHVTQADMADEKLLLLEDGHCLRDQALAVCQLAGAREDGDFKATSLETIRQMVRGGLGISLIPDTARFYTDIDLAYLPFQDSAPKRVIALTYRKTSTRMVAITHLANILKDVHS